jgi:membrane-bound lytic murein transglycosylase D
MPQKKWIKYFTGRGRTSLLRYLELSGRYAPFMAEMLEERNMPRDLIFLAMAESGFQNHAKSHARAVGPWQFIASTGKKFGLKINWYVDERRDPIKSTIAASSYLRDLYKMFGSWELAAAGYNAGEGKVARAVRKYSSVDFWHISKNRFLKSETRNYVPKIMALAIIGKNLESFGLEAIDFRDSLEFELVKIPPLTDLVLLAQSAGWELEELQLWNPELTRWFSPPGLDYHLRVPIGFSSKVHDYLAKTDVPQLNFQTYQISKRDTFSDIGKRYRIPAEVLYDLNEQKRNESILNKGDEVILPFRVGQHGKERMYADLYEKVRSRKSRRNFYDHIANAKRKGPISLSASEFYVVRSGDTLWDVSRKTGVPLETLIRANLVTVENGLRPGVKLAVR